MQYSTLDIIKMAGGGVVNSVGSSLWCCFGTDVVEEIKPLLKERQKEKTLSHSPLDEPSICRTPNSDLSYLSGFGEEVAAHMTPEDSIDVSFASPYSNGYASQLDIDDIAGEMAPETKIPVQINQSSTKAQRKLRFDDEV